MGHHRQWNWLLLVLSLMLPTSVLQPAGACSSLTLTSLSGTVSCPSNQDSDTRYSANLDSRWIINTQGVKLIKFVKVDVDLRSDNILIYENTDSIEPDQMRFRINSADASSSEFWLTGKTLVRFNTGQTGQRTGFKFFYECKNNTNISASTEVIRQRSGTRFSHPGFETKGYPNNLKLAWSIHVPNGSLLTIKLSNFNTYVHRDVLRIYSGILPNMKKEVLFEFSGNRAISKLRFSESVTLLFSTGGSFNGGFAFQFSVAEDSTCFKRDNLSAEEGTVSSSSLESEEDNELCWLITAGDFVGISFKRLDADAAVHIYANSDVPMKDKEVVQLSSSDALKSELWLSAAGLVLIRMKASPISRFEFAYRTNRRQSMSLLSNLKSKLQYQEIDVSFVEQIKSERGFRSSISGHRSFGVSNDLRSFESSDESSSVRAVFMWVINSRFTDTVTVRFSNLSKKLGMQGKLEVFSGSYPGIIEGTGWNVFDSIEEELERQFFGGATIIYSSSVSAHHSGFRFEFNVGRTINPLMQQWSGMISGNNSMKLMVQSSAEGASAECLVKPACGNRTFSASLIHSNQQYLRALYSLNSSSFRSYNFCISGVRCTFHWPSGLPRRLEDEIQLSQPDPESAVIELMEPQQGSLAGVVRFRVVTESTCPSVKHRCEVRAANGKVFAPHLLNQEISEPVEPHCLSSVTSQYLVVIQSSVIAGSVIKCRLLKSGFVLLELLNTSIDARLNDGGWELPLLVTSSSVAVLAVIALSVVVSVTILRSRRLSRAQQHPAINIPNFPDRANPYVPRKHPASEIYLN